MIVVTAIVREKHWIKLKGFKRPDQVIRGAKSSDGDIVTTDEEGFEHGQISRRAAKFRL
jgi:ATP-dependent DNA ligase